MKFEDYYCSENEKPLDRIPADGGFTGIFRKIAVVGDSLASGEFESKQSENTTLYHDCYEHSWGQYLGRICHSEVLNFSRGGMTAMEYCEGFADEMGFWDEKHAADAYIIALGVNDLLNFNHPVGSVDDVKGDWKENGQSFIGYYAKIIQRYKEISPKARFFLMTSPRSFFYEEEDKVEQLEKQVWAVRELCRKFDNTFLLDFYAYAPDYDQEFYDHYGLGGHLSPMGYLLTAKMVAAYIDYLIRKEPEAFKEAGYIRTPWDYDETHKYPFPTSF